MHTLVAMFILKCGIENHFWHASLFTTLYTCMYRFVAMLVFMKIFIQDAPEDSPAKCHVPDMVYFSSAEFLRQKENFP